MDHERVQTIHFEQKARDSDFAQEKEDALEVSVLCLMLVVSIVGVGLLATLT